MLAELDTINWLRFERRLDVGRDWPWPETLTVCSVSSFWPLRSMAANPTLRDRGCPMDRCRPRRGHSAGKGSGCCNECNRPASRAPADWLVAVRGRYRPRGALPEVPIDQIALRHAGMRQNDQTGIRGIGKLGDDGAASFAGDLSIQFLRDQRRADFLRIRSDRVPRSVSSPSRTLMTDT
jgi:hypothetical protein